MGYESVDRLQTLFAQTTFGYASDRKKAAGRALGTLVETITFYLLKHWELERYMAIERKLCEFANPSISHNVEFSLHGGQLLAREAISLDKLPMTGASIVRDYGKIAGDLSIKSCSVIDRRKTIKNACTVLDKGDTFYNVHVDSIASEYTLSQLVGKPFVMFECKRVGVEEGMKKGPQTIEKAKQGSYVARSVSSLQRVRRADGGFDGIIFQQDGSFVIDDYDKLLARILASDDKDLLRDFVLTVGVVSNHGNWFTANTMNKELRVLAQSYDWLLFLTDDGLSNFISDLLLEPIPRYVAAKEAFEASYCPDKKGNCFTKSKIWWDADVALRHYFNDNAQRIEGWFNVIAPRGGSLKMLRLHLATLAGKNWQEVYDCT